MMEEFIFRISSVFSYEPHHEKTGFSHMRKQGADQLCSNCTADLRLCFRFLDINIISPTY